MGCLLSFEQSAYYCDKCDTDKLPDELKAIVTVPKLCAKCRCKTRILVSRSITKDQYLELCRIIRQPTNKIEIK